MSNRLNDSVTVKLQGPIRDSLERVAKDNDKSMSEVAREYIIDGLRNDGIEVD